MVQVTFLHNCCLKFVDYVAHDAKRFKADAEDRPPPPYGGASSSSWQPNQNTRSQVSPSVLKLGGWLCQKINGVPRIGIPDTTKGQFLNRTHAEIFFGGCFVFPPKISVVLFANFVSYHTSVCNPQLIKKILSKQ